MKFYKRLSQLVSILLLVFLFSGCSEWGTQKPTLPGEAQPRDREVPQNSPLASAFVNDVKPLLDKRCVVCHGCYDAPCQLKLSSIEGIDRGFSPEEVYALRFKAAKPARLFIDEQDTQGWRARGYHSVLNERDQTPQANLDGSVMYQMLLQKQQHPLPDVKVLPDSFDFSLERDQQCPSIDSYDHYKKNYPLAGMPYGLPGLTPDENKLLSNWIQQGSPMAQPQPLPTSIKQRINEWESLLNGKSNKQKLISRYIYEHLFLGNLYFSEEVFTAGSTPIYFRLVRSSTPPGEEIKEIASRRPYDDPGVKDVYYRLREQTGTVLAKTHLPYALNIERKHRWEALFFNAPFSVPFLPKYGQDSNPFITFASIPPAHRYQFMLDEAQFFIMGFIKGPVCRGQVALSVIQDNFWVFFSKPSYINTDWYGNFIYDQAQNLAIPSVYSTQHNSISTWLKYAKKQKNYVSAEKKVLKELSIPKEYVGLNTIWTGNENAGLTIFRNIDSAAVVKGLQGKPPKTAWVIGYSVLERIHYLLVAGYDVYSALGHQLTTRLYMDFLRLESEMSFVVLLPKTQRRTEIESWYIGADKKLKEYLIDGDNFYLEQENSVIYETDNYKEEALHKLKAQYYQSLTDNEKNNTSLNVEKEGPKNLNNLPNIAVQQLPQSSVIMIEDQQGKYKLYSLLRHDAHKNISSLLNEEKMRTPEFDTAQVFQGVIGTYPQVIFKLKESEINAFEAQFNKVTDLVSYQSVIDNFGVRRTDPNFWAISDQLHQAYYQLSPIEYGLLDYNRLENK